MQSTSLIQIGPGFLVLMYVNLVLRDYPSCVASWTHPHCQDTEQVPRNSNHSCFPFMTPPPFFHHLSPTSNMLSLSFGGRCPAAHGAPGPVIRSKSQLWPKLQLQQHGSSTYGARPGTELTSQRSQDTGDPVGPQWELWHILSLMENSGCTDSSKPGCPRVTLKPVLQMSFIQQIDLGDL